MKAEDIAPGDLYMCRGNGRLVETIGEPYRTHRVAHEVSCRFRDNGDETELSVRNLSLLPLDLLVKEATAPQLERYRQYGRRRACSEITRYTVDLEKVCTAELERREA